jgi:hypothetical protein
LNLRKAFENWQDRLLPASWLWPAFKIGKLALAAFKIGKLALAGYQIRGNGSGRLSKVLGAATRNLLSNRSKGFELASFKKLFANSKAFRAKRQRIY